MYPLIRAGRLTYKNGFLVERNKKIIEELVSLASVMKSIQDGIRYYQYEYLNTRNIEYLQFINISIQRTRWIEEQYATLEREFEYNTTLFDKRGVIIDKLLEKPLWHLW